MANFTRAESLWITANSDAELGMPLHDDSFPLVVKNETAEEFAARMFREILIHQNLIETREMLQSRAEIAAAFSALATA